MRKAIFVVDMEKMSKEELKEMFEKKFSLGWISLEQEFENVVEDLKAF